MPYTLQKKTGQSQMLVLQFSSTAELGPVAYSAAACVTYTACTNLQLFHRITLQSRVCNLSWAALQESCLSAFSQWRAAASSPDLPAFLADSALVRTALLSISKAQATAGQLAKTIADKTEAGFPPCLVCLLAVLLHHAWPA